MTTNKSFKLPFIIFLAVYFTYLVVSQTPATWVAWAIQQSLPNTALTSINGTVWKGSAASLQIDIGPSTLPMGTLKWTLSPLSMLSLSPCITFSTDLPGQSVSGELCSSVSGARTVHNLKVDAPVSHIQSLLPTRAEGRISLEIIAAELDSEMNIIDLDGRFSWQNARVNVDDNWFTLGSYAAKLSESDKSGIAAEIFDLSGNYGVLLDATWIMAQPWRIAGTVTPKDGASPMVREALQTLGEERDAGAYYVQWPL
jgi:general secretion pathway protein N